MNKTPDAGAESVRTLVEQLQAARNTLLASLNALDADIQASQHTLKLLTPELSSKHASVEVTGDHIRHCKTQRDVLFVYAHLNDGLVPVGKAARLITDAGLTKGKFSSVRSTLTNHMSKDDNWEWDSPGTYRLLLPQYKMPTQGEVPRNRVTESTEPNHQAILPDN